jgi:2-C-methyl-D-erythritol 4-phosphate cytidylyltransferase
MKIFVIIPSGGTGKRTSESIPKQYIKFSGKEMIAYTLDVFQNYESVDSIVISAQPEYFDLLNKIKDKYSFSKISHFSTGGITRQQSVYNALKTISADPKDLIIIHDAARPMLSKKILSEAIKKALIFDNTTVAIKAKDTLAQGNEKIARYIDRDEIYYIQTPQIFRYDNLVDAFELAEKENFVATDESMLIKNLGKEVELVEGSSLNFKITTDDDIRLFRLITEKLFEFDIRNI